MTTDQTRFKSRHFSQNAGSFHSHLCLWNGEHSIKMRQQSKTNTLGYALHRSIYWWPRRPMRTKEWRADIGDADEHRQTADERYVDWDQASLQEETHNYDVWLEIKQDLDNVLETQVWLMCSSQKNIKLLQGHSCRRERMCFSCLDKQFAVYCNIHRHSLAHLFEVGKSAC